MPKQSSLITAILCLIAHIASLQAQSIQPTYPATEFIRMNGQVIAAEHMPPASASITVSVSPKDATLGPDQQQTFKTTVTGTTNTGVSWSISPDYGTMTQTGVYTAPSSIAGAPIVTVTATSQADPTKSDSSTVTFYDPNNNSSNLTPGADYPIRGAFLDFNRAVHDAADRTQERRHGPPGYS